MLTPLLLRWPFDNTKLASLPLASCTASTTSSWTTGLHMPSWLALKPPLLSILLLGVSALFLDPTDCRDLGPCRVSRLREGVDVRRLGLLLDAGS